MNGPTQTGDMADGQLVGGPQDGRDILIPLHDGMPPLEISQPSGTYILMLELAKNGLFRYHFNPSPAAR